jgi:hypothetical protein
MGYQRYPAAWGAAGSAVEGEEVVEGEHGGLIEEVRIDEEC